MIKDNNNSKEKTSIFSLVFFSNPFLRHRSILFATKKANHKNGSQVKRKYNVQIIETKQDIGRML